MRPGAKQAVTRTAFRPETQFCMSLHLSSLFLYLYQSEYFALVREIGGFLGHLTNAMGQIQTWCKREKILLVSLRVIHTQGLSLAWNVDLPTSAKHGRNIKVSSLRCKYLFLLSMEFMRILEALVQQHGTSELCVFWKLGLTYFATETLFSPLIYSKAWKPSSDLYRRCLQ